MPDYFVHPSSYIDPNVSIGSGTKIWFFCHIQSGAVIGENEVVPPHTMLNRDHKEVRR